MAYCTDLLKKDYASGIVGLDKHKFINKIHKYEYPHVLLATFTDNASIYVDEPYVDIEVYTTRLRFVYHYNEPDNIKWTNWKERGATISFEELWKIYDNGFDNIKDCVAKCNKLISDIIGDSYKKNHTIVTNLYRREYILESPEVPVYNTIDSFRYSMKDILSLILDGEPER